MAQRFRYADSESRAVFLIVPWDATVTPPPQLIIVEEAHGGPSLTEFAFEGTQDDGP